MKLRHKLRETSPEPQVSEQKPAKLKHKTDKSLKGQAGASDLASAASKKPSSAAQQQRAREEQNKAVVAKRTTKQNANRVADSIEEPPQEAPVTKAIKAKPVEAKSVGNKRKAVETERPLVPSREASPEQPVHVHTKKIEKQPKQVEAKSAGNKRKAVESEKLLVSLREASPEQPEQVHSKKTGKPPRQELGQEESGRHESAAKSLPKLKLKSKKQQVNGSDSQAQEPQLEASVDAGAEGETQPASKKRKVADSSPPASKKPFKPSTKAAAAEPSAPQHPPQLGKGASTKHDNGKNSSKGKDFAQELQRCHDVVKQTMAVPEAAPFNEPVDPVGMGIPDYFDVIKEPMDLSTIDNNLRQGVYRTPLEVLEQVRKVWSNCAAYNNPYDPIMDLCKSVQKKFNKFWSKAGLPTEATPEPSTSKPPVVSKDTSKKEKIGAGKSKVGEKASSRSSKSELAEGANEAPRSERVKGEKEAEVAVSDDKADTKKEEDQDDKPEGVTALDDEGKATGSKSKSGKESKEKGGSDKEKSKSKAKPPQPPPPKPEPAPIQPPQKVKIRIQTPAEIEKARKKKRGDEERVSKSWAVGTAHHKVDCRCIVCEQVRRKKLTLTNNFAYKPGEAPTVQLEATEPDEVPLGEDGQPLSSDQIMIEVSGKEAAAWVEAMRKNLGRTTQHVKEMEARVAAGEAIVVPGGPRLERKPIFRKPLTPEERAARMQMQTDGRTRRGAGDRSPTGGLDDDEFLEVIEVQMQSPRGRPMPPGYKLPPKAASTEVLELSKFWLGRPFQLFGQAASNPLHAAEASIASGDNDTQRKEAAILSWLGLSLPASASASSLASGQPAGASAGRPLMPPQPGMVYDNVACCWRQPAKGSSGTVACL